MGTNYYLYQKCNYDSQYPGTVGGDHSLHNEVQILTNGYVWNNIYYDNMKKLNKDYYRVIHIGKNSYGWKFALCCYPTCNKYPYVYSVNDKIYNEIDVKHLVKKEIKNLDDWLLLFNNPKNKIVNEYGLELTSEEMIRIINKEKYKTDELHERHDRYTTNIKDKNYDLILSGNDPDICCVFS